MRHAVIFVAIFALFGAWGPSATSQDTLEGMGYVRGYTPGAYDTRDAEHDILVDASRPSDASANRYKTLLEAVEAAQPGTRDDPTVIGLLPDVYITPGTLSEPGLTIDKDNITLIGLTDDRRKVVIGDNRGNMQGASNNGWSVNVAADGFSAINLTFVNYCNFDYIYPGDPSKNLYKRSDTITQALAIQTSGDRHYFLHVAFLSRLDTAAFRASRSYFSHSYIEGTDDFLGTRGRGVWVDSEIDFITGGGILYGGGTTFIRTRFKATEPMEFYKALVPGNTLINSELPNVPVAWHAWRQPPTLNEHSYIYGTLHADGRVPDLIDSAVGEPRRRLTHRLTEEQLVAFNPYNLLRWGPDGEDDGWDPAGLRETYETYGALPYRVTMENGAPSIRTGEGGAEISAAVWPAAANSQVRWETDSDLVTLSAAEGGTITVTGANTTDQTEEVMIRALADNGLYATAWVTVAPPWREAPEFSVHPVVRIEGDTAEVIYGLDKDRERVDQSQISWFVCAHAACGDARRVAVSRAGEPTRTLPLTPAMSGMYLKAEVIPRHDISQLGRARSAVSEAPVAARASDTASLEISTLPDTTHEDRWNGDWLVTGAWIPEAPGDGEERWGLRVGEARSSLIYTGQERAGDMDITLVFDTDKYEGQGFGMPSSWEDDARLNADILFKYDPETRTGYSVRMWRTTQASDATMFQVFRIEDGVGSPHSGAQQLTGVLKPTTTIRIEVRGAQVRITGANTADNETLDLTATIQPNDNAGAGISWPSSGRGGSIVMREMGVVVRD